MNKILWLVSLLIFIAPLTLKADEKPTETKYEPAETRIAILPLVNKAAEYSRAFKEKIKASAENAIAERFTSRRFKVIEMSDVTKVADELKIDVADRENWRPEKILPVGKKLGATIVLLCVITDAHSKDNVNSEWLIGSTKEGFANVRAYMIDVITGKVILNGVSVEGKSHGFGFGNLEKGMDRQAKAVLKGFDKALKEFLTSYPVEVKAK